MEIITIKNILTQKVGGQYYLNNIERGGEVRMRARTNATCRWRDDSLASAVDRFGGNRVRYSCDNAATTATDFLLATTTTIAAQWMGRGGEGRRRFGRVQHVRYYTVDIITSRANSETSTADSDERRRDRNDKRQCDRRKERRAGRLAINTKRTATTNANGTRTALVVRRAARD